ncbi:MAG: acetylornithine deacetylase [Planctomycetaceae bacterium]|nr:acetylornithine deacetylase [Planctomycetaceae bacterium]|tara:strand:- start:2432 stop:3628 length:1197 start_codon:yes stop_codon:yes gene_type:complete
MSDELFGLLQDLVRTPSVNPMGRDVSGDIYYEGQMTSYLEKWFTELGVEFRRNTLEPGRDNIAAILPGSRSVEDGGRLIMLEAHQDTVPVDGMTVAPFDPIIQDGKMYGRGSCDIKGGMACMLTAFKRFAETPPPDRPTVIMACTVNEEFGMSGAAKLCDLWLEEQWIAQPDAIIVAEPTLLDVVVAHKGVTRFELEVTGVACHSSQPELGRNAIYRMARIIQILEQYASEVVGTLNEHPLVTNPTMNVGMIEGGISVNTVPDRCSIEIGRRTSPTEIPEEAYQHILDYVKQHIADEDWADAVIYHEPTMSCGGLSDQYNDELASYVQQVVQSSGHSGQRIGVPYGTDAQAFSLHQIPTVVFGPGSIDQAHTKDEWIELEQLTAAAELYYQLLANFGA